MTAAVDRAELGRRPLPTNDGGGGKHERGSVLVVAGSRELPGAALLAGNGTLRAGAGRLQIFTGESIAVALGIALPESMVVGLPELPGGALDRAALHRLEKDLSRAQALLVGPGLADGDGTAAFVADLLDATEGIPVLLDAAAMMPLDDLRPQLRRHGGRVLVTPHAGEMAGILGRDREAIEADPAAIAREVADRYGIVVALKGACTRIAAPGEAETWSCDHGHPGLGTAGSGDTLAGIVAGLMARGVSTLDAALWGVYVHGEAGHRLAGSRGPLGFLAREIPDEVPAILAELCRPA